MCPKIKTIKIHAPTCPPPTDRNWLLRTPPDGYQYFVVWPLGKTLAQAAAPLLAGLYEMVYGQKQ